MYTKQPAPSGDKGTMIEIESLPGHYITNTCRLAAVLARSPLADAHPDQDGAYYLVRVANDDATLLLGPWYLRDGAVEAYEGEAFWEHCREHAARDAIQCHRAGVDAGVRFVFNDVTVECEHGDDRPIDEVAKALVQQWEAKRQAAHDAYWTPERKAEQARREAEHAEKMAERRTLCEAAAEAYPFEPTDPDAYAEYTRINAGGYSGAVVRYGEQWAALMEKAIDGGLTVVEAAEATRDIADHDGITGFMYGAAVNQLARFWKHGEALRVWHNGEYGHTGDGVVNPAVLTVKAG